MDYTKDIAIDVEALDLEWLEQPSLMMKYSKNAADCKRTRDIAKEGVDLIKAEIDKDIRKNPGDYGVEKITETVVMNAILEEVDYQSAMTTYIDARHSADVAAAAVSAFEQRKQALEGLVKLFGLQYFAGPSVPRNITSELEMRKTRQENTNTKVARKLTRK